ncbi:MAG: ABC transporter [Polaromonas sp. 24-62-144]|jgi:phospholipid-binding lipoprotein MlaA|uniref:MlaA family lipoprotein n=1 Tax=Polaromonas sp. TaxID=1869339 RepID=UPI000BC3755E|nr:VacJ family lipoprotein [Polaromonas sp.]OYY51664.1 MAG: ABC transporter [Polaromonas sp. 35-63-240]OYY95144.1 MAG: ABC transporter [Polaromonas sp. 28-63-22]OYZ82149.1 MAG: ABC transporter [Polaromonas sp. 24-62-144]HQS32862.1 VacJ family lipoprotein [Polaromonas sp.]HQS91596.1 VacJ family lipoprotein [Polaromonas sp.]
MTITKTTQSFVQWAAAAVVLALAQGCASGPGTTREDPLEPFNRTIFSLNDKVDTAVVKPVASAYREVTPKIVRTGVTNFFGNLADVWSTVNNVLQAKPQEAAESLFRVTTNTIFGLGGILDVASEMRIPRHSEDFGQTLGYWGVPPGPYLVLPVLGPSTFRDSAGTVVDFKGNLATRGSDVAARNTASAIGIVNKRANLLDAGDLLDQAALDKYSFVRDVYLQRRRSQIGRSVSASEERYDLPEAGPNAPADASQPAPAPSPAPAN